MAALVALIPVTQSPGLRTLFARVRIFGENPLLAYVLCFLLAQLVDMIRNPGHMWIMLYLEPRASSLVLGFLSLLLGVLLVCHRRRWLLKA